MRIFGQEQEFDSEWTELAEEDERIWKEEAELANKGRLIFETSAIKTSNHGEQWIKLYEKAIIGREDWQDNESHKFEIGLAMIKNAWCDEKGDFIIEVYMGAPTILYGLEHPYRLQYLINKHRGIQEKVSEPWIESE